MYGMELREWDEGGVVLIELWGDLDQHNLAALRDALRGVVTLRRPTVLDLSGVTFLDTGATRELVALTRLYSHHLALRNPSWQARRSIAACGFEPWLDSHSNEPVASSPAYPRAS